LLWLLRERRVCLQGLHVLLLQVRLLRADRLLRGPLQPVATSQSGAQGFARMQPGRMPYGIRPGFFAMLFAR
jgi:hypothetical protein